MNTQWPMLELRYLLTERREKPSADGLLSGALRIVEKIAFDSGEIRLRETSSTRTSMILVRPGDCIVSGINAAKGAIGLYEDHDGRPVAATTHYASYSIDRSRVRPHFLWRLLRSPYFREILATHVPGGIKTELKPKRLLRIEIPVPPLDEQKRIEQAVAVISREIADARLRRASAIALAQTSVEATINQTMLRLGFRGVLGDVLSLKPRSGPSFVTYPDWPGTPVLMPSSVTGFGVDTTRVEYGLGTERVHRNDRLTSGDVLIARGNKREQVGNAGVVPETAEGFVCANLLMRMKVKPELADPFFLVYWLRAPFMRTHVRARMTGTNPNIQKINQKTILAFPFPTGLGLREQRRIVAHLDAVQAEVDSLKSLQSETARELEALLEVVLDRAFRGAM